MHLFLGQLDMWASHLSPDPEQFVFIDCTNGSLCARCCGQVFQKGYGYETCEA